jgi:hypothetical protein
MMKYPSHKNNSKQCINSFGKAKKTFNTFEEAVAWAKKMNQNPKFIHKQVAYKCRRCLKFHTGRSPHNTLLKHDENIYRSENPLGSE